MKYSKHCPSCNAEQPYSSKRTFKNATKRNARCNSCANGDNSRGNIPWNWGLPRTEDEKLLMSAVKKRKHKERGGFSDELRVKWSQAKKGRKQTEVHKRKIGLAHARRNSLIERLGNPNFNIKACALFNEINTTFGWSGVHAQNGGEHHLKELCYWLDYYEPSLNLVIEFDEYNHRYKKENDAKREKIIKEYLNCKFERLTDQINWKEVLGKYAKI